MNAHLRARLPSSPWPAIVERWLMRVRDRAAMAAMTERDMRDVGLTPYDVTQECRKPFWRE